MIKYKKQLINGIKGLFLILLFISGIIGELLKKLFPIDKPTTAQATILNFVYSLIFAMLLLFIYWDELKKEFKTFKKTKGDNIDVGIKYWLIGLFLMMCSNILINVLWNTGTAENEQAVQKMISSMPIVMLISAGVLAPFTEEILFRKCFRDTFTNNLVFVITSGIFFGFLHVSSATTFQQFMYIIPYSCLGISFALMYVKTKSVFTSMMMHATHNTLLTLLSILIR